MNRREREEEEGMDVKGKSYLMLYDHKNGPSNSSI